ncbi:MAG: ABC transporter substrate-binding protein [Oscillospiraceae bacterium]|nr:ABC transporter substrate-binding protein [Oscillospiraceae bacterium]
MTIIKKISSLILAGVLCTSILAGCSSEKSPNTKENAVQIGIIQLVEHDSLDTARQGFIDRLASEGYVDGQNLEIDYQNAQGDQSNCVTIADKFVAAQYDLILAISTPASQAMVNATDEIPILVCCVTDPAASKLCQSNEIPGCNVSGTSDLTPVAEQIELLKELVPDAKTVGLIYSSSESNSKIQIEFAKEKCSELGLEIVEITVAGTNEIHQSIESVIGKVDALYTPSDNVAASSVSTIAGIAQDAGIPFIVSVEEMVKNGGTATLSLDYYKMGEMTADQAVSILRDGADISKMPIQYQTDEAKLVINEDYCKAIGLEIPASLKERMS